MEKITIKVRRGQDNQDIEVRIPKNKPFKKLFEAVGKKLDIANLNQVRFIYDGERLLETQTPDMVQMENDDQIDIQDMQDGGN